SVRRNDVPPLRELGAVAGGHVLKVLGHPKGQIVLIQNLRVGLPQLSELLHELVVAKDCVRVVRRIIDDPSELGGRCASTENDDEHDCEELLFHHGVTSLRFVTFLLERICRNSLLGSMRSYTLSSQTAIF